MVATTKGAQERIPSAKAETAAGRIDGYLPIEQYAAIGDGRALALVGVDGAIDWMCVPDLDSPSIFGALLDPESGGCFVVRPSVPYTSSRRYLERTNVLETTFHTDHGQLRLLDALTIDESQTAPWRELVRELHGVTGTVPVRWEFCPRFGYGRRAARLQPHGSMIVARDHGLQVGLSTWDAGQVEVGEGTARATCEISGGERALIATLVTDNEPLRVPERAEVERRLAETLEVWRSWVSRHSYDGPWIDAVERSLLAIRLLTDARTGAIAAAGTTSLPEVIGGERNYDYRFGWVRDLCFTLDALLAVGMEQLTQASVTWLLAATRHTHPRVDPVYALGGDVVRTQHRIPMAGYRRTTPVHVGNKAGSQLQLGGFGDFVETIATYVEHGHILPPGIGERLADLADLLSQIWRNEDSGLWELTSRAHYGTSKLGCWVAFERLLDLVDRGQVPARHPARWKSERDQTRRFIEQNLFSQEKGSYVFKAGSNELDCGILLAARRGFGPSSGPRITGTIDAIRRELQAGGPLLYRYSGMQNEENAFLACSFWMVEAMALAGRLDDAAELMQAMVRLGNDVGLYSEEMEPVTHAMRGNFPQALTHLALISAARVLERCRSDRRGDDPPSPNQPSR
jgi:GH15 family glucan-1,4-alpha-glucosidase